MLAAERQGSNNSRSRSDAVLVKSVKINARACQIILGLTFKMAWPEAVGLG